MQWGCATVQRFGGGRGGQGGTKSRRMSLQGVPAHYRRSFSHTPLCHKPVCDHELASLSAVERFKKSVLIRRNGR